MKFGIFEAVSERRAGVEIGNGEEAQTVWIVRDWRLSWRNTVFLGGSIYGIGYEDV